MKYYEKPSMKFVLLTADRAVADVCWAHVNSGKPLFFNTSGPGYATITMTTTGGCAGGTILDVKYSVDMTVDEQRQKRQEIDAAVALANGGNAQNFKGSPFFKSADPSWS